MAKSTRLLQRALNNVLRRIEKIVSGSNGDVDHLLMQAPELEKLLTIHRAIEVATGASDSRGFAAAEPFRISRRLQPAYPSRQRQRRNIWPATRAIA